MIKVDNHYINRDDVNALVKHDKSTDIIVAGYKISVDLMIDEVMEIMGHFEDSAIRSMFIGSYIGNAGFSTRTYKCLNGAIGIHDLKTVQDLVNLGNKIKRIPGFGGNSYRELKESLANYRIFI